MEVFLGDNVDVVSVVWSLVSPCVPRVSSIRVLSSRSLEFSLQGGRRGLLRCAQMTANNSDFNTGHYRFKISPRQRKFDYSLFALVAGRDVVPYVFETCSIADMRTLFLCFVDVQRSKFFDSVAAWHLFHRG